MINQMKRWSNWIVRQRLIAVAWLILCGLDVAYVSAVDDLRVGVAEVDITPPIGFPIAGYYHERLAEGTVDPLKAKAMVFEQGEVRAAMVACDLTGISRDLCEAVRKESSRLTGIPAQAIAVTATHSHTAPDYSKHLFEYLKVTSEESSAGNIDVPYAKKLIAGIVQAVVEAQRNASPAVVASGSAQQQTPVSFNRRFVMKNGSVQTWKNLADPQVVRPAGPIDPELSVVMISNEAGHVRGILSNFALHLDTVGGLRWSADYPFFIEQAVRKQFNDKAVSIFGTGCCGDINHSDPSRTERNKTDFIGNSIGETLVSAGPELKRVKSDRLQVRHAIVDLDLQDVTPEQLERSMQLLNLIRNGGKVDFLDQVAAYKSVIVSQLRDNSNSAEIEKQIGWGLSHAWGGIGKTLPVDVQTICIGDDLAIVFLPGEVFVELGLAIKQGSPYRNTLVVELSNCVETAYIPTRAACAGGSYEVTNSTLKPGGGELLVEAALKLLRESASSKLDSVK